MEYQQEYVQEVAAKLLASGFALPAMITIESLLPLHNILAELGELSEPLWQICTGSTYGKFKELLRSREGVEALVLELETVYKKSREVA